MTDVKLQSANDLNQLWGARSMAYGGAHKLMYTLVNVYNGQVPEEFKDFFHKEQHIHLVNMIRLAWDDLANLAGKTFPLFVQPDNDSSTAEARSEKQEMIGYGYNRAGRAAGAVTMDTLMKVLMWWLVGTANAVLMVLPDYENKSPFFTFRDPRSYFPPVGYTPFTQTKLEDALFAYQMTVGELKVRYPDAAATLSARAKYISTSAYYTNQRDDDSRYMWVSEYYNEDLWMVATLEDHSTVLASSEAGQPGHPGVNPVVPFGLYNPDTTMGRSMFADQMSIQAAMSRMFSQKLDFFDRTLYPLIFTTPLAGKTIKVGPYAVNEFDTSGGVQPRLDTVAPAHTIDADQTMGMAMSMSRMLNRNPEQMQGAGDANSSKAISRLMEGVTQTIRGGIWPSVTEVLPTAYETAAKMDIKLWGNEKKSALGTRKNSRFKIPYRPNVDLKEREGDFQIEPGATLGGYQGMLQMMQLVGAELKSEDTALEEMEGLLEPREEKRKIQGNRLEKLTWAMLEAGASGQVPGKTLKAGALSKIMKLIKTDGVDLFDAIDKVDATGDLYEPPPPPEEGMGGLGSYTGGGPAGPQGPPGPGLSATGRSAPPAPPLQILRGGPPGGGGAPQGPPQGPPQGGPPGNMHDGGK